MEHTEHDDDKTIDLSDQVALVTGGGRGIGRQIALALARAGARVTVVARSAEQLRQTAALAAADADGRGGRGGRVHVAPGDMTDEAAVRRIVAETAELLGPVSLLVNNAAVFTPGEPPLWEADLDAWWRTFEVNVRGPLVCCRAALPAMVAHGGGRVITVSSDSGVLPFPLSSYSFSKNALVRLTEALDLRLAQANEPVRAFAVSPGTVRTALTESFAARYPDMAWTPAEDSGRLVVALASGRYDALRGRYLSVTDELDELLARMPEVSRHGLLVQRLRRFDAEGDIVSEWE